MMKDFAASSAHQTLMIRAVVKIVKAEIKSVSGRTSPFRRSGTDLESSSWDSFVVTLKHHLPVLVYLLECLMKKKRETNDHVLALIASMLLKNHNDHLCLLQSVISVLFYAKGCQKQVCACVTHTYICILVFY